MDDDYSGHRVINKTIRTACIPASYPSSPQKPILDWDWRFGLKEQAEGSNFAFARAGSACVKLPGGIVAQVGPNVPRYQPNGLLLEGSAQNVALWSNSFTAEHGHTLNDCTTSVSPTEYLLTDESGAPRYATILTATANIGRVGRYDIAVTAGTPVNWSVHVKAISGKFRLAGYDGSKAVSVLFDCATRTFSNLSDPGAISSQLLYNEIGNGWFRLSVTITPTVTASNAAASIGLELAGNSGYISGAQFVVGPVVTSYIYTEDVAITRASEGADTSGNGLSIPLSPAMIASLSAGGEGTIIQGVELSWPASAIASATVIPVLTSTNNGSVGAMAYMRRSTQLRATINDGVTICDLSGIDGLISGKYAIISQFSAPLGRMRVGLYNPSTRALTWSHSTLASGQTYRGFFPIHSSNRLRFLYSGGQFPVKVLSTQWFNTILTDTELIYHANRGL